jgi:hypothetical protein
MRQRRRPHIEVFEMLPPQQPTVREDVRGSEGVPPGLFIAGTLLLLLLRFGYFFVVGAVILAVAMLVHPTMALISMTWLVACVAIIVWDKRRRRRRLVC